MAPKQRLLSSKSPTYGEAPPAAESSARDRAPNTTLSLIDRVRSAQGVVDFVDIGVGGWRWPTFNVADSAITVGAIALALSLWQEGRAHQRAKEAQAAEP